MTETKARRIVGASVSCAILLLSILLSIILYQTVLTIRTRRNIARLENQIKILQEQKEQTQDEIEIWETDWKIDEIARELGYYYGDDKK